jgi:hypothetical protein
MRNPADLARSKSLGSRVNRLAVVTALIATASLYLLI